MLKYSSRYANVKEADSTTALPPLGRSDHNLVYLRPLYKPAVQRQPVVTRLYGGGSRMQRKLSGAVVS